MAVYWNSDTVKGPIYCSIPTGILLPLVLEDALKVGFTRNWRLIGRFLKQIHKQLVPLDYRRWSEVPLHDSARQLRPYWDKEARRRFAGGRHPLSFEQLTTLNTHAEHLAAVRHLKKTARPTIVIAASGMCAGGRIVNYLKALVSDPRTDVLFVGYQARGTPGRIIQTYGPRGGYVELDGKRYDIRAGIHTLSGYSAHADRRNLINFVMRMRRRPQQIRLLHGDPHAKQALKRGLVQKGFSARRIVIPGVSD